MHNTKLYADTMAVTAYHSHDCKATAEDGCATCAQYEQVKADEAVVFEQTKQFILSAGVENPEEWLAAAEDQTVPVRSMLGERIQLRNIALRCVGLAGFTMDDYAQVCHRNGLLMF